MVFAKLPCFVLLLTFISVSSESYPDRKTAQGLRMPSQAPSRWWVKLLQSLAAYERTISKAQKGLPIPEMRVKEGTTSEDSEIPPDEDFSDYEEMANFADTHFNKRNKNKNSDYGHMRFGKRSRYVL